MPIDYLVQAQTPTGLIGRPGRYDMYAQGITVLALAEAAGMTRDPKLRPVLDGAVAYIVAAQQAGGGWDYRNQPRNRNDTSVTCWQVMALVSAARTGVEVPDGTLRAAMDHLDRVTLPDGRVQYLQSRHNTSTGLAAAAAFCRLLLGWDPDTPTVKRSIHSLRDRMPSWDQTGERSFFAFYYWY